jgi:peptidoglycan-associated lipoprotein
MRLLLLAAALLTVIACRPPVRQPPNAVRTPDPPAPPHVETDAPPHPPRPHLIVDEPPPAVVVKPPIRDAAAVVEQANAALLDAYFPYDRAEVTADALSALRQDAAILLPLLREFPQLEIVVEGHCDERGSAAYNLGLGARRAERGAAILETFGLPPARMRSISYGNERPQCETPVESCWRLNRRAHLELRIPVTEP